MSCTEEFQGIRFFLYMLNTEAIISVHGISTD